MHKWGLQNRYCSRSLLQWNAGNRKGASRGENGRHPFEYGKQWPWSGRRSGKAADVDHHAGPYHNPVVVDIGYGEFTVKGDDRGLVLTFARGAQPP